MSFTLYSTNEPVSSEPFVAHNFHVLFLACTTVWLWRDRATTRVDRQHAKVEHTSPNCHQTSSLCACASSTGLCPRLRLTCCALDWRGENTTSEIKGRDMCVCPASMHIALPQPAMVWRLPTTTTYHSSGNPLTSTDKLFARGICYV